MSRLWIPLATACLLGAVHAAVANPIPVAQCYTNAGCTWITIESHVGALANHTSNDNFETGQWTLDAGPPGSIPDGPPPTAMYASPTQDGIFGPEQVDGYVRYVDPSFNGITPNFFWQDDKLNDVSAGCDFSCTVLWNPHNADPPPPPSQYCDEDNQYQCQHSLRIHVTIDPAASPLHPTISVSSARTIAAALARGIPFRVRAPWGDTISAHAVADRPDGTPLVLGRASGAAAQNGRRYVLHPSGPGRRLLQQGPHEVRLYVTVTDKDGVGRTGAARLRVR